MQRRTEHKFPRGKAGFPRVRAVVRKKSQPLRKNHQFSIGVHRPPGLIGGMTGLARSLLAGCVNAIGEYAVASAVQRKGGEISIVGFMSLAAVSGVTIGMSNIVIQLFAISIGADPFQIGIIGAMEATGMMLLTVPAGFVIARHGAKLVYATASIGPVVLYALMPLIAIWWGMALLRLAVGICIPFRTVSMSSAFLGQLQRIGPAKAGWYRASLTLGMAVIGPALATFLTGHVSFAVCFLTIAVLFAGMAAFSLSFFPEREETASDTPQSHPLTEIRALLANPDVSESCAIEFASGATNSLFATFVLLVAASLPGLTARDGVTVILVDGIVTIGALFLGARLLHRLDRRQAYAAGLALGVAALAIASQAGSLAHLVLAGVLLSLGAAVVHLVNMILLSRLPGEKSKASGVYQLSQMLGAASGALAGGILSKAMPLQSVFLAWILALVLVALPIWRFGRKSRLLSRNPTS